MTQSEKNALARELGITPEACPWAWIATCPICDGKYSTCEFKPYCILPDPTSGLFAAKVWDGFLLEALGWQLLRVDTSSGKPRYEGIGGQFYDATTAALLAAWQGRVK